MARVGFLRRHRAAIASNTALVIAAGAVLAYAVSADGYQAHEAELNDGGIWVVNGKEGLHGRINKPINQLDSVVFADRGDLPLDVVQDGAAVLAVDERASTAQVIKPSTSELDSTGRISVPTTGDLQLAGGTLASVDAETGGLWAARVDTVSGASLVSEVDRQSDPVEEVGEGAALAVSQAGTAVVTSAEERTVTYLVAREGDFADPRTEDLPDASGEPTAVTTVGETVVTLDAGTGTLAVLGGPTATVPEDSVLQQAGPSADAVLVASRGSLMSVDLGSGRVTVVTEGVNGQATEPVRLGACEYAAWSGGLGTVAVRCGDDEPTVSTLGGKGRDLAFRVNRGEIVLNDGTTGSVWDVEDLEPQKIDNWNAFTASKKVEDQDKKNEEQSTGDRRPPKAKPDQYGARPGRTTVLHPLDNDSAPDGRLLSIVEVDEPTGGAQAEISPDGQTIVLSLPEDARDTSFAYFIDDGRDSSDNAVISVDVRGPGENRPPGVRDGYEAPVFRVPAAGALSVPVLADWRDDDDGDTVVLDSAVALGGQQTGAVARTTSDGRIRFTAPRDGGEPVRVQYAVTDGRSAPVERAITFQVQDKLDQDAFEADAQPDVVRGEVGQPIKIRPLLNDLPGSDPSTPETELALGGKLPGQSGATIRTDLENGIITFTGSKAGTFFLDYDAAYGNAPLDGSTIRVDVQPARGDRDPVAMPDSLTVYGQSAAIVDVLANDLDPAGGLLAVQRAEANDPDQLDVAIIDGRWLRISARQGALSPNPQLVSYTISNGPSSSVEGEVSVSLRPAPKDNSPVTASDRVHVRAGTSVTAPVLDNDLSPSGDRLSLLGDVVEGAPGELEVIAPLDVKGDVGRAFVSGRTVRYVAPPDIKQRDSFQIPYVAANTTGQTSPGRLTVIITPADAPNTAPEPPTLESRVVSGDTVKVRLPGSGVDPDGDPVTIAGITSAPRKGRLVAFGGNYLEYQAYPRTVGTDEFEYSVVDTQGAAASGTVRVVVVPPEEPQSPLAVDDQLTVEPRRTATFDPFANDFVAPGDDVQIELVDPPAGVSLDDETSLVTVPAPERLDAAAVTVVYEITNGIDRSRAVMRLETAENFNNPPVLYDAFGRADDSESVTVDVLDGAYDPDGRADDLRVAEVLGDPEVARIDGDRVKANRAASPLVVPFRVEDADGASATASLYVPPTGTGIPYVKPDALIELERGGRASGKLEDYVVNPSGGTLRLTGKRAVNASPAALQPAPDGERGFTIESDAEYRGPGALLLEVTTATDPSGNEDPQDPADGYTALLSVPVQVGDDTPELTCPETTIPIAAGQVYDLDIGSLCNVWTLDPGDVDDLVYDGTFTQSVQGVSVAGTGSPVLRVSADEGATEGGTAVLSVTAGNSNAEQIRFRLDDAPPPSLLPIRVDDLEAGQSRTYDLAPYLEPGVSRPDPTVVSVDPLGGSGVTASASGSSVTLKAGPDAQGTSAFRIVMSDVSDSRSRERTAEGRIQFEVRGTPGAPGPPRPYPSQQSQKISMGWEPPSDDGGSPITHYVVQEQRYGKEITCRTNECDFGGLDNGKRYTFKVAAVNKVGRGEWSSVSKSAFADTAPGRVDDIRMKTRGDHTITIAWKPPTTVTSKVLSYHVTWLGGEQTVPGDQTSLLVGGLDNNTQYSFTIKALNKVGYAPPRTSDPFQPLGTPAPPGTPTVADLESGLDRTSVRVTWPSTLPEGPGDTLYTVSYSTGQGAANVPGCVKVQALTCVHSGVEYDGSTYAYTVRAHNVANTSGPSQPATFQAVGRPAAWGAWAVAPTGADQQLRVTATAPDSRGAQSIASILVGGQVVWTNSVKAGAGISEVVPTSTNEAPAQVQLRMCNEFASQGGCSYSDAKTAQSYGPLRSNHLNQPTASVNGLNVVWTISGTSNGDAAIAGVSIDGGPEEAVRLGGPGQFSFTRSMTVADFNRRTDVRVRLYDDAPSGRGEAYASAGTESGDPPPPTVNIYKQRSCNDGDDNPDNDCSNLGQFGCTNDRCGFLGIRVEGARENFGCQVTTSTANQNLYKYQPNMSNGETVTDWVFDAGYIEVTCEAGKGGPNYFRVKAGLSW
ncbi:fibronectin type III domain-containing protein [Nocardioides sediminis]|uniref:fibronectin type III domain-containing protein n=1 Tax=Nocardioides sediminis TaxID=433648 RepID=UPI00131F1CEC|nr:fibronectin type III domain-containing protein [Nocardioides sediminis]